jgi:PAS domain S-box-containing protein
MTALHKTVSVAKSESARSALGGRGVERNDAAPALFKLLADSTLYRAAFAACRFPMAIVDATTAGRPLLHVNPAFESFFGLTEAEARGRALAAALCRGDADAVAGLFAESAAQAAFKAWRKDGTAIDVDASAGPVRDARGHHTHWVVSFACRGAAAAL